MELDWMDEANCRDEDPDLFFDAAPTDKLYAEALCESCPVRTSCATFANKVGGGSGMWAGLVRR